MVLTLRGPTDVCQLPPVPGCLVLVPGLEVSKQTLKYSFSVPYWPPSLPITGDSTCESGTKHIKSTQVHLAVAPSIKKVTPVGSPASRATGLGPPTETLFISARNGCTINVISMGAGTKVYRLVRMIIQWKIDW